MLEYHNGGVDGVILDPPEELLDQRLPGVNLQGLGTYLEVIRAQG